MSYYIDLQYACTDPIPFSEEELINWAKIALTGQIETAELTLRFVDSEEITQLNADYRQKNTPTNVLAFPSFLPKEVELESPLLGDVIICPAVLLEESHTLNKPLIAHWPHIVIHGVLHLLGYDHIKDSDAEVMQALEIKLLEQLGFSNPYLLEDDNIE